MTFVLSNIALSNIEAASDRLVDPLPFDLNEDVRETVSDEYRQHSVNYLDGLNLGEPRESKIGQPPIVEDANSHKRIGDMLSSTQIPHLRDAILVGEEAGAAAWDDAMSAREGSIIIDTDPIDGSSNYDSMAYGFSTNFLAYTKTAPGKNFQLLLAMVTSPQHTVVWQLGNRVLVRSRRGPIVQINEPRSKVPRSGYIAAVAAMPHHRAKIAQLLETPTDPSWELPYYETGGKKFHDPTPAVNTMGGAPATIGLVIGRCSASVTTSPQTIHDTAGVPAMLALNLPMCDADGPVDRAALMERFNHLDSPGSNNYTPIPPMVIGRDPEFVSRVADRTFNSEPMDLVAVPRRPRLKLINGGMA
jgi:hypothetical protein